MNCIASSTLIEGAVSHSRLALTTALAIRYARSSSINLFQRLGDIRTVTLLVFLSSTHIILLFKNKKSYTSFSISGAKVQKNIDIRKRAGAYARIFYKKRQFLHINIKGKQGRKQEKKTGKKTRLKKTLKTGLMIDLKYYVL